MTGITLRDYIREIEKQIDDKRYDEATARCHYILQSYPKAVEIYRLLGKAFLENQRYGDAADIFQRVLSVLPDDFVSHASMSIIREDEGNLDEAIWHMERAFDVQAANGALQEELRRMYGRRDNVAPTKIRMTRSALARMYFKGELYPQAIAELRTALAESPDRLDLQALLTEVYTAAGQKAEAVEAAAKLICKLPYCIVANRVLYETLRASERDAEAQTHRERLNQVDPYFAFISETYPTVESVPDSAICLAKMELKVRETNTEILEHPSKSASLYASFDWKSHSKSIIDRTLSLFRRTQQIIKGFGKKLAVDPIVIILGLISSLIAIYSFFTGQQSVVGLLPSQPTKTDSPEFIETLAPTEQEKSFTVGEWEYMGIFYARDTIRIGDPLKWIVFQVWDGTDPSYTMIYGVTEPGWIIEINMPVQGSKWKVSGYSKDEIASRVIKMRDDTAKRLLINVPPLLYIGEQSTPSEFSDQMPKGWRIYH